jgi:hypothetical protein
MYIIAIAIYLLTIMALVSFPAMRFLFHEAISLAPEVAGAVCVVCLYPLGIFLVHLVRRMRDYEYGVYLTSQAKLAASLSVSLGLIGTFQGLTEMVSTISKSMQSGGDDLVERMNVMISSISSALSSMSYAFITSIFGVASSVIILLSLNYMVIFYKKKSTKEEKQNECKDTVLEEISEELRGLNSINISIMERLLCCNQQNKAVDDCLKNISEVLYRGNMITEQAVISISQSLNDFSSKLIDYNEKQHRHMVDVIEIISSNIEVSERGVNKNMEFYKKSCDFYDENISVLRGINERSLESINNMDKFMMAWNGKEKANLDKMKSIAEILSYE